MQNMLADIYAAALPPLIMIIGVYLGRLLNNVADKARDRWEIEIEARHREALHSALMTGISSALSRGLPDRDAMRDAVDYVRASGAPDATAFFGLSQVALLSMAESKLAPARANGSGPD